LAYVHLQKDQREEPKHGTHTRFCTFIAYHDDYKGWEFLEHETGNRVISRDVFSQENAFEYAPWIPWPEKLPIAPQQPAGQLVPPFLDDDLDLRGNDPLLLMTHHQISLRQRHP